MDLDELDDRLTPKPSRKEEREPTATSESAETESALNQRLNHMIAHGRIPPYLTIQDQPPVLWDDEPTAYAIQARREWQNVAEGLSIPVGEFYCTTQFGVVYKADKYIHFDIQALWRSLGIA